MNSRYNIFQRLCLNNTSELFKQESCIHILYCLVLHQPIKHWIMGMEFFYA